MARALAVLFLLAASSFAQVEAGFGVRSAVIGETVPYVIRVQRSGEGSEKDLAPPELPVGDGYEAKYADRRDSQSQQVTIVNGEMRRSVTTTTQFVYDVTPTRPGALKVPAFTIEVLGKKTRIPEASLRVETEAPGNQYVEVRVTPDPAAPWVNQPLTVHIEVVSKKPFLSDPQPTFAIPWFAAPDGFVGDAPEQATRRERDRLPVLVGEKLYNFTNDETSIGGEQRYRLRFDRDLVPIRTGKLTLDPAQFSGAVADQVGRDLFGQLVARSTAKVVKASPPVVLDVREVPESGKPDSFTNAVGDLAVKLRAGPSDLKAGDPVTVTLTIAGRGNIEGIKLPDLRGFESFTRYDPETKIESAIDGDPKRKRLTATWLVFPKSSDVKELPKVAFSWFGTKSGRYETEAVGPLPLRITGTISDSPLVTGAGGAASKRAIAVSREIVAIKPDYGTLRSVRDDGAVGFEMTLVALPLVSYAATALFVRRRERLSGDAVLRRKLVASKSARLRLADAGRARTAGGDVTGALASAIAGFVADKLSLPPASVTAATIGDTLRARKVPADLIADAEALLRDLDLRRFSAGSGAVGDEDALARRVETTLAALERRLK